MTFLRWLVRYYGWRLILFYIAGFAFVAAVLLSTGCATSPTASTPAHPYEELTVAHTRCYSEFLEMDMPVVIFTDDPTPVPCVVHGEDRMCPSAGRAYLGANKIVYWRAWIRNEAPEWVWSLAELKYVAAHEVCHLALATSSEPVAVSCAHWSVKEAGC